MMDKTYFFQNQCDLSEIKIGKSFNPEKRLKQVELKTGKKLKILAVVNFDIEDELHLKFKHLSIGGEWFVDNGEILGLINNNTEIEDVVKKKKAIIANFSNNFDYLEYINIKNGMFVATDLVRGANKTRKSAFNLSQWIRKKSTLKTIGHLNHISGKQNIIVSRGRDGCILMSDILFFNLLAEMGVSYTLPASSISSDIDSSDNFLIYQSRCKVIGSFFQNCKNKNTSHIEIETLLSMIDKKTKLWGDDDKLKLYEDVLRLSAAVTNNYKAVTLALKQYEQVVSG